ncbi:response regulator [Falsirhodobacter algicola]|uniref:histidine kinase n=2 Tax=Falsirhodobacter algicola TaxID=2692330 RepID=A0A8J8SLY6_9RHOB|nr:response regulator [Falsirhodobacter algicola]
MPELQMAARVAAPMTGVLLICALGAGSAALIPWEDRTTLVLLVMAMTFAALAICLGLLVVVERGLRHLRVQRLARLMEFDTDACFATDLDGGIARANAPALRRFGTDKLTRVIGAHVAQAQLWRQTLASRARHDGAASAELPGTGGGLHVTVQRIGRWDLLWRIRPAAEPAGDGAADLEHVPVALVTFEGDGSLSFANRAAREILQIEPAAAPTLTELFEGLGRPLGEWLAEVLEERVPTASEVLRLRGHASAYVQISLRRLPGPGAPRVLAVLIDATALKTLEAQFNQSQKMQAIGQLAGGVAHDFNNLLTAISGHCDLLLLRHQPNDAEYADLMQIHQNVNRATSLIAQLLAFSRKQTQVLERIDLQEVLADAAHLLNRLIGARVNLDLRHGADLWPVQADRRQLEQVLMNLVVNARDAMPEGGTIRIDTEAVNFATPVPCGNALMPPGDYVAIRVADSGMGIPEDQIDKIFEPFFTTKRVGEGTGLGLSTVYGIVKQTGGFILVNSTPGKGSTFTIFLPRGRDLPAPRAAAPAVSRGRGGTGVILLVEDEAPVRSFAARALRMRGHTVLEADCAEAALALLDDATLRVDLFITDVVMPGMDGPSWVRKALEARPEARTIFVSGYAEDTFPDVQVKIANSTFLPKPFSLTQLTDEVQIRLA